MDKHDYNIKVDSERLRAIRKRARITQSKAAQMLGMSIGAYKSKEAGDSALKDSEKLMLRDLFHMSYDEFDKILFGGRLGEMKTDSDEDADDFVFFVGSGFQEEVGLS